MQPLVQAGGFWCTPLPVVDQEKLQASSGYHEDQIDLEDKFLHPNKQGLFNNEGPLFRSMA